MRYLFSYCVKMSIVPFIYPIREAVVILCCQSGFLEGSGGTAEAGDSA